MQSRSAIASDDVVRQPDGNDTAAMTGRNVLRMIRSWWLGAAKGTKHLQAYVPGRILRFHVANGTEASRGGENKLASVRRLRSDQGRG